MPISEAQKRASRKWNDANLERINFVVKKGEREKIKKSADNASESVNTYIRKSVADRMQKEGNTL